MALPGTAFADHRASPRDEVHYRARALGANGRQLSLLIVNLSAQGLMARSDDDLPAGAQLSITLPVVGLVVAEVRWSLGGRIGCALDSAIELAEYYELLAALTER